MINTRLFRLLQSALLAGLGLFLAYCLVSGRLFWYIHQRFIFLTVIGLLILLALAVNGLVLIFPSLRQRLSTGCEYDSNDGHYDHIGHDHDDHDHTRSGWALFWLALPLAVGLLLPARPLGSSAAILRGVDVSLPQSGSFQAGNAVTGGAQVVSDQRTVLDWIRLFNYESDLTIFLGQQADIIAFVYHDQRLTKGQFLAGRFTIVCCVADAFAIGMAVEWPQAASLPADQWVRVKGPVQALELDGQRIPLILAESVEPVAAPAQPYLFP